MSETAGRTIPAFVIISGGARPASIARLLSSLATAGCPPSSEVLIVGRFDGPIPPGVRMLAASDLATEAAICAMRNQGIDATSGDPVVLLDDDVEFTPGWWAAMAASGATERFDIAGCRCLTPAGRRWYDWAWASREDPVCPPRLLDYKETSANAYVSGCFMMIRRRVLGAVRFDEQRMNHERDDVDFCHRAIDAGFTIGIIPAATVIHHLDPAGRSASDPASGSEAFAEGITLLRLDRHAEAIERFRMAAPTEGSRARYHEGVCLMELGRREEAKAAFAEVVVPGPGASGRSELRRIHYSAMYRLGVLCELEGREAEAHALYAGALAGFPEHHAAAEGLRRTANGAQTS